MADRIHPRDSPQTSPSQDQQHEQVSAPRPAPPAPEKPVPPPPGTYVVQIPKDQIYKVPPPENADRYKRLSRRKSPRSRACRCCRFFCFSLILLIVLLAIAAGIFYLVFRPESPKYTVDSLSINGFNLTFPSSSPISPEFNVTVTADNPNNKIGIYYLEGSSVKVYFKDVNLYDCALPTFFQPRNNVTVFKTVLKKGGASAIELTSSVRNELVSAERRKTVPFKVNLRVPVKIKVGSVKSWKIKVKVRCDVTVDKLTSQANIVSKDCDYSVDLW